LTYDFLENLQPVDVLRGHFETGSGFTRYHRGGGGVGVEEPIASLNLHKPVYKKPTAWNLVKGYPSRGLFYL